MCRIHLLHIECFGKLPENSVFTTDLGSLMNGVPRPSSSGLLENCHGKRPAKPSGVANVCAHLLLRRQEVVFENNVSVKQSIGSRQYRNCLSFV